MQNSFWKLATIVALMLVTVTFTLSAKQGPPAGGGQGGGFKNLKVFPQDVPRQQLMGAMNNWTRVLGVKCDHCHVEDKAADTKPEKEITRNMMKMTTNLRNSAKDFLGEDRVKKVSCWTCHRGSAKIEMPAPPAPPAGAPAAPKPPQE